MKFFLILTDFGWNQDNGGHLCVAFQKKIIDEKHLRYNTDLKMGEDGLFNLLYLSYCKKS